MKRIILSILISLAVLAAFAKTQLPEQSVVIPGYDEQVARERFLESDLQPLEGIWYYPAEDMTLAIERWLPEPSHKIGYRLLLIASDDLEKLFRIINAYCHIENISQQAVSSIRDSKDLYLLSFAETIEADFIVTGDNDLLILNMHGKTRIVSPAQFKQLF